MVSKISNIQQLHLEDALEDTPQMRSLVDVFERDANMLKKYMKAFSCSCQKLAHAQTAMVSALQEVSYYLRLYDKQNFPLATDQKSELGENLNTFANHIDEMSTWYQVLVTQLNETMTGPLNNIFDHEFNDLQSQSEIFNKISSENEEALTRFLKIPFKKDNEQQRQQANEECSVMKRKFHQTAMNYYSSLNSLQLKRKYMILEPVIAFMNDMKIFFKMGSENMLNNSTLDHLINDSSGYIQDVKEDLCKEEMKRVELIDIIQQDPTIYYVESIHTSLNENMNFNNLFYKSGYLNMRTKYPFISRWDRYYFFTQNGCLMHQLKNEIAGYSLIDLKSDLILSSIECDERRFVFQISSLSLKKTIVLQANSERDREEWIKILGNIVKDDSRTKLMNYKTSNTIASNNKRDVSLLDSVRFDLTILNDDNESIDFEVIKGSSNYSELFDVRFLGLMTVKADKGNEYINDTIRQIMGERAQKNLFKMEKFRLLITDKSIYLINSANKIQLEIGLSELAFWSSHKENDRLFGFIIKEKNRLKFQCYVFETDTNSQHLCDCITNATKIAFKNLVEMNSEKKRLREEEKKILLSNINKLPNKSNNTSTDDDELLDVNKVVAFNSPNPNFILSNNEKSDDLDTVQIDESQIEVKQNTESDA